jgi:hypothetical protein
MNFLLNHAVGQLGRDRIYSVTFGVSTPTVRVFEDETLLADFWTVNGVIHEKKFY